MVGGGSNIPKRVPGVLPSGAQAVPEPSEGHLVDYLRRARGDPRGPLAIRVSQEVVDDLGVHRMDVWLSSLGFLGVPFIPSLLSAWAAH